MYIVICNVQKFCNSDNSENNDVFFVLDQHAELLAHWNNSLLIDMSLHLYTLFLIPSQPVIVHTISWCILSWEATNTNFI
jgi:hypothetical protein